MATDALREVIKKNKAGEPSGIYSVCSAHPMVLVAAVEQAKQDGSALLIEATSNQVDQFGGYTGMTPAEFRDFVLDIVEDQGFPKDNLILGGDHLGPNRWQKESPEEAMAKAEDLVRAYVEAGYTKIHLDCSMSCKGDPVPLTDAIVAERAARLLAVAEDAASVLDENFPISYVIGTEVPVPGGAHETLEALTPTPPENVLETIRAHKEAFAARGLGECWSKVLAIVVQPAVEFDHVQVIDYVSANTEDLRHALDNEDILVFEAHSTDYQTTENLTDLVTDKWGILKVGPGLTFALREGLFALAAIEDQLVADPETRSNLIDVIEDVMVSEPVYWKGYYEGTEEEQKLARKFSYSDRVRYYLPNARIEAAIETLLRNLETVGIPDPLVSQYLPPQYDRLRKREIGGSPRELLIDRVRDAIRPYAQACGFSQS